MTAPPPRPANRTGIYLVLVLILFGLLLLGIIIIGMVQLQRQTPPAPPTTSQPGPTLPPNPTAAPAPPTRPGPTAPTTPDTSAALDRLVSVYFTAPRDPDKPEERKGGLDERLTDFVKTAKTSIDVAIYDLDLDNVTIALIDAKKRGLTVRVVTDTDNLKNKQIGDLKAAAIPVVDDQRNAIMHDKFVVVDRSAVWMGSWNFTIYDTYRYNNNGALWRSKPLAERYTAEFEQLFAGKFGARSRPPATGPDLLTDEATGIRLEVHFTHTSDVTPFIVERLKAARSSITFMAFSFTSDPIGQEMLARSKQGVQVRGVFERTGSETSSSEFGAMKQAGLDVLQDGNRYLMHHKVIVIDERVVVFGSFNFSANAEDNNENCLIVESPALARLFLAEFDRVREKAVAAGR